MDEDYSEVELPEPVGAATGFDWGRHQVTRDFTREQLVAAVLAERKRWLAGVTEVRDWAEDCQAAPRERWQMAVLLGALVRSITRT